MGFFQDTKGGLNQVGMPGGDVVGFTRIGPKIVKLHRAVPRTDYRFPISETDGAGSSAFIKFPN